jgi:hypothetical protein
MSAASNAFASLRSRVLKPSVNQPKTGASRVCAKADHYKRGVALSCCRMAPDEIARQWCGALNQSISRLARQESQT